MEITINKNNMRVNVGPLFQDINLYNKFQKTKMCKRDTMFKIKSNNINSFSAAVRKR